MLHDYWFSGTSCFVIVGAVDLDILSHAFLEYGWEGSRHNSNMLSVLELESLLNKVFQLAQRGRSRFLQPDKCVELTLNWSLGCLDRSAADNIVCTYIHHHDMISYSGRTGVVKLRSLKIVLSALCSSVPEAKYSCKPWRVTCDVCVCVCVCVCER